MFDIGFSEIIVCAVVALIVIGPERMPETVRTIGLWIGRFKRSLHETRQEIERQIGVEDIRRQLHNEDIMRSLEKTRNDINHEINSVIEHTQSIPETDTEERKKVRTYENEQVLPDHAHDHAHQHSLNFIEAAHAELDTNIQNTAEKSTHTESSKTSL